MVPRGQGGGRLGIVGVVESIKGSSKDRKARGEKCFGKAMVIADLGVGSLSQAGTTGEVDKVN